MSEEKKHHPPIFLYAVPIHQAIATGDLATMKNIAAEADAHLATHGDVSAALEVLKTEIAKLEGRH
jgi:hypothetical protein